MSAAKVLVRVPVPPGAEGPARLLPALAAALDGSGPAVAPIPTVSASVSNDYVMSLLAAVRADDASHPLESDEVAVVLATSGSTGAPRGVLLTAAQLTAMTAAVHGPGASPQWIAALPVTSMGGFNVLVRSLAADREPVVVASIGGAGPFTEEAFEGAVDTAAARADDVRVALVPAQLARLLAGDRGIAALQRCAAVLVGGAATRPSLLAAARDLGIRLVTTYGATETAGGCVFDGIPLPGVRVTADGSPGLLTIAGPCVALGYRGEPELTRRVFTDVGYQTSDLGEIASDGTVTIVGRADDVVIIRGVNVSPLAIERVLADLPHVAAAAVVTSPGRDDDAVLHAFLEVRDTAPWAQDLARVEVERRLGLPARPLIHRVDRLPHLPNGKVDRRLLQEWAARPEGDD
jgi:O-succinylbenzoic acid--CoA ligase